MAAKIDTDQTAKGNCSVCGSANIGGVCHHCNCYICQDHLPKDKFSFLTKKVNEYNDIHGFCDAGSGEPDPVHCPECKHYVRTFNWLLLISGFILLIVYLKRPPFPPDWKQILIQIAAILAALSFCLKIMETLKRRFSDTKIPVLPIWSFKIEESIICDFNIDEKPYSEFKDATGRVTVEPFLTDADKQRYEEFMKTYFPSKKRKFDTGSIIFENLHRTSLRKEIGFEWSHLRLIYQAKNYEELIKKNNLKKEYTYEITDLKEGKKKYTFWFIPHLTERKAGLNLEIHLIIPNFSEIESKIEVKNLEVNIPTELEKVTDMRVDGQMKGKIDPINNVASWTAIAIKSPYTVFELDFSKPVINVLKLIGKYELSISKGEDATFSSVTIQKAFPPALLAPNSKRSEIHSKNMSTKIQGELIINTSMFIDEELHIVTKNIPNIEFYPDYQLVDRIIAVLKNSNVYIKRLAETSSWRSLTRPRIKNRYWSFFGRYYHNIYPLDVHLILSGQEAYELQTKPFTGISKIELTISARISDSEMRRVVEDKFEEIYNCLQQIRPRLKKNVKPLSSTDVESGTVKGEPFAETDTSSQINSKLQDNDIFSENVEKMPSQFDLLFKAAVKELRTRISFLPYDLRLDAHQKLSTAIDAYRHNIISTNAFNRFLEELDAEVTSEGKGD